MKKLYRKGTVHPSPPIVTDHLSFLPAAILTLAAALSTQDREVLAYLITFSSNNNHRRTATGGSSSSGATEDHSPVFNCSCFRCYTNYWVRWDSSPNRQLIHEIIDSFEEWLQSQNKNKKLGRKDKRNNNKRGNQQQQQKKPPELAESSSESTESDSVVVVEGSIGNSKSVVDEEEEEIIHEEKGSVRRFVSFIGERIWGAANWGQQQQ